LKYSKTENPFIWCQVPKVGGTSWSILFINTWYPEHNSSASLVKAQNFIDKQWGRKRESEEFWIRESHKTFSFFITRHPFSRLLSAFRDKFLKNESSSPKEIKIVRDFRRRFGKKIVKNYRQKTPSKPEYQQENVPTFREFVEYILNQRVPTLNQHWIPVYNLCMPCLVNYTIIGRKESIEEDADFILKNIGIDDNVPNSHVSNGKSTEKTLKEFYSELDRDLLERLYKLYEMDFLLFDYSINNYYSYVE